MIVHLILTHQDSDVICSPTIRDEPKHARHRFEAGPKMLAQYVAECVHEASMLFPYPISEHSAIRVPTSFAPSPPRIGGALSSGGFNFHSLDKDRGSYRRCFGWQAVLQCTPGINVR